MFVASNQQGVQSSALPHPLVCTLTLREREDALSGRVHVPDCAAQPDSRGHLPGHHCSRQRVPGESASVGQHHHRQDSRITITIIITIITIIIVLLKLVVVVLIILIK